MVVVVVDIGKYQYGSALDGSCTRRSVYKKIESRTATGAPAKPAPLR